MKLVFSVLFGALMALTFSSCERHDWSETREIHLSHEKGHGEHSSTHADEPISEVEKEH